MMIDKDLLSILACPETKKDLKLADEALIKKVNQAIEKGLIRNRNQESIKKVIDGGLLRRGDNRYLYPIRDGIPILLCEELLDILPVSGQS